MPRTISSPTSPTFTSLPSGSTIFSSTLGTGLPTERILLGEATDIGGITSVIPHPFVTIALGHSLANFIIKSGDDGAPNTTAHLTDSKEYALISFKYNSA